MRICHQGFWVPEPTALLDEAARVWAKGQILYESPAWQRQPPGGVLVQQTAQLPEGAADAGADGQLGLAELADELLERRQHPRSNLAASG
jgi:hypothetical protein